MRKTISYILILVSIVVLSGCEIEQGLSTAVDIDVPIPVPATVPIGDAAQVVEVIDGDTINVVANGVEYRLRYIGVDTPERDEPYYSEATAANRQLVRGKDVILVKDVSDTDQYGRLLRYVYLPDGTFVNATLIDEGYARIVTFPPDVAQQKTFSRLQKDAREAGRGLWGLSEFAALPAGCNTCTANRHNCGDFQSQRQAQACYEFCLVQSGEDIHHLDGGGDGVVCESLP